MQVKTNDDEMSQKYDDGPIRVRPWAMLLPDRGPVHPIDLDQLSSEDRDLYLRDFLPPDPTIGNRKSWEPQSPISSQRIGYADLPVATTELYDFHFSPPGNGDSNAANRDQKTASSVGRHNSSPVWPIVEA